MSDRATHFKNIVKLGYASPHGSSSASPGKYNSDMRRTDLMDTKLEVHREIVRRLRAKTPAERASLLLDSLNLSWTLERRARTLGLKKHGRTDRSA